jgi:hypothetical protein
MARPPIRECIHTKEKHWIGDIQRLHEPSGGLSPFFHLGIGSHQALGEDEDQVERVQGFAWMKG